MRRYIRTWLYVSAVRKEHFVKALESDADAVVFDLEDSVAHTAKDAARDGLFELLRGIDAKNVAVRINAPSTTAGKEDLAAMAEVTVGAIRIPKVESAEDVAEVGEALNRKGEPTAPELQPIVESVAGLTNLESILTADGVRRICLGEGDLSSDLAMDRKWFDPIRIQAVVASRAMDAWQPIQGVYSDLGDEPGLRDSTESGKSQGFFGRSVIHPRQVAVVNAVFTPDLASIERARRIVTGLEEAESQGSAAIVMEDGSFADLSTIRSARDLLAIAGDIAASVNEPHDPK